MAISRLLLRFTPALAAILIAAGCGGINSPTMTPVGVRPDLSTMAADAKTKDLLYVADQGTNDVYVLSYPQGKLEATISGWFGAVDGACVDTSGNVFITDSHNSKILKFAHGGSSPIASLEDAKYSPVGCSVDPKTGNLAVANVSPVSGSGSGNVAIYKNASGGAKWYTDSSIDAIYGCAYDGKGNLYVSGSKSEGAFALAEIRHGKTTFTNLSVDQQIYVPGGIQWDGKHLAIEDQGAGYHGSTIYQFSVSGTSATKVGTISLGGSTDVFRFWIFQHKVIGGNIGTSPSVMYWKYPAGGSALRTITGFTAPAGITVSPGE